MKKASSPSVGININYAALVILVEKKFGVASNPNNILMVICCVW
jgi:hypothetical protein